MTPTDFCLGRACVLKVAGKLFALSGSIARALRLA
jgi:hypothetical protein